MFFVIKKKKKKILVYSQVSRDFQRFPVFKFALDVTERTKKGEHEYEWLKKT